MSQQDHRHEQDHLELTAGLKDGLSRFDRLFPQLVPENIPIDDRDTVELVRQGFHLSKQFNYYNSLNLPDGDWEDFFTSDAGILMMIAAGSDMSEITKQYKQACTSIYLAENRDELLQAWDHLLAVVSGDRLDRLLQQAADPGIPGNIQNGLAAIRQNLDGIRTRVDSYRREADSLFAMPESPRGRIVQLLTDLHGQYTSLEIQFNQLHDVAAYFLAGNDWRKQQHTPHLGLWLVFLQLYACLQQQLNQLTGKHLDFYYREVLGTQPGMEIPAKVHVLPVADLNAGEILLKAGEEMLAEIPGREIPLTYRLQADTLVTKAKVEALQTLFISNSPVFGGGDTQYDLLRNAQVYIGEYPVRTPELLLKDSKQASWPLFGEDQDGLPFDQRSMSDTDMGLLLASPVFYLTEGRRRIQLTFYIEPGSFTRLNDYIDLFAKASLKTPEAMQHELLGRAFEVSFTTPAGWSAAETCSVRIPSDNLLEIVVELKHADPPFVVYRPGIHGPDYKTGLPVLRLLINNGASHNAYALLNGLLIERMHISVQVNDFRQVKLQNSIGNLSPFNAFQPFGPLPAVGSNLDIKNTNVFNRYTTDVAVCLEWMELPKQPGGFGAYYEGYNAGIADDAFYVGISALTNGVVRGDGDQQQAFPLFNRPPRDTGEGPASVTRIKGIDCKKLQFTNYPLLDQEQNEPDGFFTNGTLRLELLSPPEAFGHALFPKIFPDVALHNARLWNKKRPLPNQPYTPKAKSVSLSYTLEHAEPFKDIRDMENASGGLMLIHQYPSGYRKIYPGDELRSIPLLPSFDYGGNLYIGLTNIRPGEEIALLFQLDEKNYHHTLHDTDKVIWRYLQDDAWIRMDEKSILSDATGGFINTGIVRLKLPDTIDLQHTVLPAGLCWISASITGAADMRSKVVAILAQAAVAVQVPGANGESGEGDFFLPPDSIKKFIRRLPGIQRIWQPFPSFDRKPAELATAYQTRVSERLRHKNRPLSALDIEQLVLEAFPSIGVVKCFAPAFGGQQVHPGVDVQVVLVPKEGQDGSFFSDQPKVNLAILLSVKHFLGQVCAPFINIEVGNPVYEKVKIACRIRLTDVAEAAGTGSGYYLKMIGEDIRQYLCPWKYTPGSNIKIGSRIYLSEMLTYLKRLPYISEITAFSVIHFFSIKDAESGELSATLIDSAKTGVEFIQGSVPEAVLIPSDDHLITVFGKTDYSDPLPRGIGDFAVGDELPVFRVDQAIREPYDPDAYMSEDPEEYFDLTIDNPPN